MDLLHSLIRKDLEEVLSPLIGEKSSKKLRKQLSKKLSKDLSEKYNQPFEIDIFSVWEKMKVFDKIKYFSKRNKYKVKLDVAVYFNKNLPIKNLVIDI